MTPYEVRRLVHEKGKVEHLKSIAYSLRRLEEFADRGFRANSVTEHGTLIEEFLVWPKHS